MQPGVLVVLIGIEVLVTPIFRHQLLKQGSGLVMSSHRWREIFFEPSNLQHMPCTQSETDSHWLRITTQASPCIKAGLVLLAETIIWNGRIRDVLAAVLMSLGG